MSNGVIIIAVIAIIIFSNWSVGFFSANFQSSRYEVEESIDFLSSKRIKFLKLIRPTEKLQAKSNVLIDKRSFLRKIYSTRTLHILITESEKDTKQHVIWVELIKSWNFGIKISRKLNYFEETNTNLTNYLIAN